MCEQYESRHYHGTSFTLDHRHMEYYEHEWNGMEWNSWANNEQQTGINLRECARVNVSTDPERSMQTYI